MGRIVSAGDAAGAGHANSLIIDMYFVEVSAGFGNTGENTANGLALVGSNGITMHTGDNLVGVQAGRDLVAQVAAHEIAHNLGLSHVQDHNNLMGGGRDLTDAQIARIQSSRFTAAI